MPLFKSAQTLEQHTPEDEIILYEEKPSAEDIIELHQPDELNFTLSHLPGSDSNEPLEVSEEEKEVAPAKSEETEVLDPWDWQGRGLHQLMDWVKERFDRVPRHSGKETGGIERVISYLKRLNNEMSKAISSDYDGEVDLNKFERARKEIYAGIERLEEALEILNGARGRKKKSQLETEMVKEAKQTRIDGIIITVPLLISRIARVIINGMVSGGHDAEDLFNRQVEEYKLDKREQAELMQLLSDMGFEQPRRDRGWDRDHKPDYTSSNNFDFGANYPA